MRSSRLQQVLLEVVGIGVGDLEEHRLAVALSTTNLIISISRMLSGTSTMVAPFRPGSPGLSSMSNDRRSLAGPRAGSE